MVRPIHLKSSYIKNKELVFNSTETLKLELEKLQNKMH